jgi:hypothetical protein
VGGEVLIKVRVFSAIAVFVLLVAAGLSVVQAQSPEAPASAGSDRLVAAYYYAWFDENTWRPDIVSDMPTQPYRSTDRSVISRHIDQAKSGGIDSEHGPNPVRALDILLQLSQSIPKELDMVFSRMVYGNDGLTLSGEAAAFNAVDEIKSNLEKSGLFKQVTISSANMDRGGNKVLFKLKIDL